MQTAKIEGISKEQKWVKKFQITVGITFALSGGWFYLHKNTFYLFFFFLSTLFLFSAFFSYLIPETVKNFGNFIAHSLGRIITVSILILLFYLVISPISLLLKLFNRKPLELNIDSTQESYWIYREPKMFNKKDYEELF
tara:strand:- start:395 stop:811 length:417 start_codon:yes stop_codon:yes gene_type:complete